MFYTTNYCLSITAPIASSDKSLCQNINTKLYET